MKVLSLFDGISCARIALDRAGIVVDHYYSSEIDKYAIEVSKKNWSDIIQIGDVTKINKNSCGIGENIDLLIGGSPCQDLSIARSNRKGLKGEKSSLFYEYLRILKEIKPKYFILENVASMPQSDKEIITKELGVEPIMINASLVSGQTRKRLFWTNIKNVKIPEDKNILLKDILEKNVDKKYFLSEEYLSNLKNHKGQQLAIIENGFCVVREATKKGYAIAYPGYSVDLSFPKSKTRRGRVGNKCKNLMAGGDSKCVFTGKEIRLLTPVEYERLQCVPDNYTEGSDRQRYKMLGNAFNVEVVKHILKNII